MILKGGKLYLKSLEWPILWGNVQRLQLIQSRYRLQLQSCSKHSNHREKCPALMVQITSLWNYAASALQTINSSWCIKRSADCTVIQNAIEFYSIATSSSTLQDTDKGKTEVALTLFRVCNSSTEGSGENCYTQMCPLMGEWWHFYYSQTFVFLDSSLSSPH